MLNILNLPRTDNFIPGDKMIIERNSLFYLIDYDNIYITADQINFSIDVDTNYENSLLLVSDYNDSITAVTLVAANVSLNVLNAFSTTQSTTTGAENTSGYRNIITIADAYDGVNIPVIINDSDVQRIGFSDISAEGQCSDKIASFGGGTIFLPTGTFKISALISLSPEVDTISLSSVETITSSAAFRKLTPPVSDVIIGTSAVTLKQYGGTITLGINGFLYNKSPAEYAMVVNTTGRLVPGVTTGTFSTNLTARSSINKKIKNRKYRQARLFIEKISDNNTLGL
jgi:hypothetical protein